MNILLLSMPDSFEHTPTVSIRMPNGALTSLAGNADPHHRVAVADLVLVQRRVRATIEDLLAQTEPDLVHPEESVGVVWLAAVDRLVANRDASLINPLLEAPQPPWPATQHGQCFRSLWDPHVLALNSRASRMSCPGSIKEWLAFVAWAIAVFGKDCVGAASSSNRHESVATEHRLLQCLATCDSAHVCILPESGLVRCL